MRALKLRRALAFDYQSGANKPVWSNRFSLTLFNGVTYLMPE